MPRWEVVQGGRLRRLQRCCFAGRRPHCLLHVEWVSSSCIVATLAAGGPASCLLVQSQPSLAEGVWWAALSRGIPGSWVCRCSDPRGGTLEMPRRPHSLHCGAGRARAGGHGPLSLWRGARARRPQAFALLLGHDGPIVFYALPRGCASGAFFRQFASFWTLERREIHLFVWPPRRLSLSRCAGMDGMAP